MIFRKTRVFYPIIWSPPVDFCLPYLVYLVLEIKLRLHQTCQIHFVVFHWFPPPAHKSRVQLNLISKFFQCLLTLFLKLFTLFAFMNIMSCHDHVAALSLYIITYLVSSRPYIEICRVCKIYGRRGGAEPSIYFTNQTYFYVRFGTDQISVLFR